MRYTFVKRALFTTGIAAAAVCSLVLLVYAAEVFLLIFAGVLVAIFLRSLSVPLARATRMPHALALTTVVLTLSALFAAAAFFAAPSVAEQFDSLTSTIPEFIHKAQGKIEEYAWGRRLLEKAQQTEMVKETPGLLKGAGSAFSSIFTSAANLVVILFIGLYGAIEPALYKRGFLSLFPQSRRARISEVISEATDTLKWWLIGRLFGMAVIGVSTAVGLWLMDVPLALTLGLIAALLTFIPNIGPIIAAVPAVLLGLTLGVDKALYVVLLYVGIQVVESYLLTPIVQRKTIELPPALTLAAQVLFGVLLGGLGLALATPIVAATVVVVRGLYVEDVLGDHARQPSIADA